ncbi:uncharacterized protein LOC118738492 [Rhagoletis pomonella]|uniref:uncharacterized protein LOC118738492 n=1 Tax=Rhagoletis pomonella TaxID=28610 RepID=UPI00177F4A5D|nr:uncharacterized protein LOC118738492 [Rhagoletis pomonella]
MCNLGVCCLFFAIAASCYVSGNTKATTSDDDLQQAINLAHAPNIIPKPYMPIQEQQKQQQHSERHPNKRSLLVLAAAPKKLTKKTRQKRSQHDLATSEEYLRNMPTYAYNLALLNIMHSLRKQLSNIELARLRSRLGRSAAADLQLFNEIYNSNSNKNNNNRLLFNKESGSMNDGELGSSYNDGGVDFVAGASLIGTGTGTGFDTGNGGLETLEGVGGGGAAVGTGNDMLANDIEDLSVPWQFVGRVSKKSSALYKPRLGKRTQQQPKTCN